MTGINQEAQDKIIKLITALVPQAKIYLFGSRARGTHRQWSEPIRTHYLCLLLITHCSIMPITIGLVGDIMLGRGVSEWLDTHEACKSWGTMLPYLQKNDLLLGNLETTLTNYTKPVEKVFNFRARPEHVKALTCVPFTVVNLANNHSLDFNVQGLKETVKTLNASDIKHVGAGLNQKEAQEPVIIERNGYRIGIIGATDNEPSWKAAAHKPGTNYIDVRKAHNLLKQVKKMRKNVDILILSIHWGPNWDTNPSPAIRSLAHTLIDHGVDIIHGHSPHIVQGIEIYQHKLIFYGMGDFLDDYAIDKIKRNDLSIFVQVEWQGNTFKSVTIVPARLQYAQVNKAEAADAQWIKQTLVQRSKELGTNLIHPRVHFQ